MLPTAVRAAPQAALLKLRVALVLVSVFVLALMQVRAPVQVPANPRPAHWEDPK
jgi:hypothetical protein